ncbi:autotransporter domain-containing protein [Mesorhizobium sp. A623]
MTSKLIARGAFLAAIGFILLAVVGISRAAETFVLPTGTYGQPYTYTLTGDDGVPPYSFHRVSGALPSGVYLTSNGVISGTPTSTGVFEIRVSIDDSAGAPTEYGDLSITIKGLPPIVSNSSSTLSYNDTSWNQSFDDLIAGPWDDAVIVTQPSQGTASITSGTLTYTKTPGATGSDSILWKASHGGAGSTIATVTLDLLPAPTISVNFTPYDTVVGDPYSATVGGSGGTGPYTVSVISGSLPDGLTLIGDTVGGSATKEGTYPFTIQVTDSDGFSGTGDFTINVASNLPPPPVAYDFLLDDVTPDPNIGVNLDKVPVSIPDEDIAVVTIVSPPSKGTADVAGHGLNYWSNAGVEDTTDSFTYSITDIHGQTSNVATISVQISKKPPTITLSPTSLSAKVGEPFSQVMSASGAKAPYTFEAFDFPSPLPDGITLVGNTLKGTPTTEGVYVTFISAIDADNFAGASIVTITVTAADPAVAAPVTTDASINVDFNAATAVDINLAARTSGDFDNFQIVGQPSKGALLENGMFASYTPTKGATGTDTFTWTATGPGGVSNVSTVTITISAAPDIDLPVAVDHEVHLSPTESGSVDLTTGATGAPFLRANVMGTVPADVGKFSLSGTTLRFTPHVAFDGTAKVGYVLENAAGTSNTAEVRFIIAARADPTKDPEVVGLLTAQAEAAKKLTDDQITTITGRLESLHNEGYCNRQNAIDFRLGYAAAGDNPDDHSKDGVTLSGKAKADCRWAIWGGGYVSLADYDRDDINFSSTSIGLTAGLDYRFTPSFVGGIAVGYGSEESSIGSHGTTSAAQAMSAALYASWHPNGGVFLDGIVGYQHLSYDSRRFVTDNGEFANGTRSGNQVFGSLTAGYEIRKDGFLIAPYVGVRGSHAVLSGFSETGGGIYGLSYGDQTVTSISSVVGVRAEYDIIKPWGVLTPSIRAEYRHDFVGDSDVSLGYTDVGTKTYRAEIKGRGKDSVTVGVGLKAKVSKGWTIESTLSTTIGNGKPSYRIGVQATYKFCGLFTPQSACGPQMVAEPVKTKAAKAKGRKATR